MGSFLFFYFYFFYIGYYSNCVLIRSSYCCVPLFTRCPCCRSSEKNLFLKRKKIILSNLFTFLYDLINLFIIISFGSFWTNFTF
ncbi:hypothetical protein EDC94DRAFT_616193 [Helicostylum pulchrum]|nr:hypothetical protein EDC94DRAFT_616193 [Helicostylum pulchrum]